MGWPLLRNWVMDESPRFLGGRGNSRPPGRHPEVWFAYEGALYYVILWEAPEQYAPEGCPSHLINDFLKAFCSKKVALSVAKRLFRYAGAVVSPR